MHQPSSGIAPATANVGFDEYLRDRGFAPERGARDFMRHMIVDAFRQPGCHRFWRVWNPAFGYALFRLYILLGGSRRRTLATLVTFVVCGSAHDVLLSLITRRPYLVLSGAFGFYGCGVLVSRALESRLDAMNISAAWPAIHAASLVVGLGIGAWVQALLLK